MRTNRGFVRPFIGVLVLVLATPILLALPPQGVNVDGLVFDLKHPEAERRRNAANQLGSTQARSAIPALVETSGDSDAGVRLAVVRALNNMPDQGAVPAYVQLMTDPDVRIQREAVRGIETVYVARETGFVQGVRRVADFVNPFSDDFDPVVVEPYEKVDPAAIDTLAGLLSASDDNLRASAAAALGTLRGHAALPEIKGRLEVEQVENVTVELIWAIVKIGDREAAGALIPLTRSNVSNVRTQSIHGLGRLRANEAVPQLTELYSSGIEERRRVLGIPVSSVNEFQRNVFKSLSLIGDPSSKGLFQEAIKHEEQFYRRFGAEGLGRIGDTSVTTDVARLYIGERSREVRLAAGFALFRLGREEHLDELVAAADSGQVKHYLMELEESDIPKLFDHFDASKPSVQVALLEVIGLRGGPDAIELAEAASSHANTDVAAAGNLAIRRLHGRHP